MDIALELLAAVGATGLLAGGGLWIWRRRQAAAARAAGTRLTTIEVTP